MREKGKKIVQISLRIEEDKLREYKKWLIDSPYRSINEHLNAVIDEVIKSSKGSVNQKDSLSS